MRDIFAWTAKHFGIEQARLYKVDDPGAALRDVSNGPDAIGARERPDIRPNLRSRARCDPFHGQLLDSMDLGHGSCRPGSDEVATPQPTSASVGPAKARSSAFPWGAACPRISASP
jgi:hypothetical protein